MSDEIRDTLVERYQDEELIFLEGLDEAIIGVSNVDAAPAILYSESKIIEALQRQNEWDYETAVEWCDYNIQRLPFIGRKVLIVEDI